MKKFLVFAALALPICLFSQVDIPAEKIAQFPEYVQLSQVGVQLVKLKIMSSVGTTEEDMYRVVDEKGKDFTFQTDAHAINWMKKQGFEFVDFIPVWPAELAAPGTQYFRKMLFKKRV